MRWNLMKKALGMAKDVLDRSDLWVDFPPRLGMSGEIEVFCQDNIEPLGSIHYQQKAIGSNVIVALSFGDRNEEVTLPRSKRMTIKALPQRENLRPILLNHENDVGFKILASAAKTKNISGNSLVTWAINGGLTEEEANKILALAGDSKGKEKRDFRKSDRVRVIGPCMEFGELAWVMAVQKTKNGMFCQPNG
jgi:uncharacterized protein YajQ (UPF0234 family)